MKRGVYFLANDYVFELAVAFLNSFRRYNPEIPLCLIPFNSNSERVASLQERYGFSVYEKREVLSYCDEISLKFHRGAVGQYRKLAAWEGDFDEFIYIDVDTIVLGNVAFVFKFLAEYDFVTSHSNIPHILKFVWKPSIFSEGKLSEYQINFAANTGFIAAQKRAALFKDAVGKLDQALEHSSHMELECYEQSFLNYLIVTSERKYTSLFVLYLTGKHNEILLEQWAGRKLKGTKIEDGRILSQGAPSPILLLHWAGKWKPSSFDRALFSLSRRLGRRKREQPSVRIFMPYKKLWRYYRFMHAEEKGYSRQ